VQITLQPEPTGPGLDEAQRSAAGELFDQPIDGVLLGTEVERWLGRIVADAGSRDGVFMDVGSDEDGGIVVYADLRMGKPTVSVSNRRSRGSGNSLTRDHGLAEVSALLRESHTV
jgi:hypothetical protein